MGTLHFGAATEFARVLAQGSARATPQSAAIMLCAASSSSRALRLLWFSCQDGCWGLRLMKTRGPPTEGGDLAARCVQFLQRSQAALIQLADVALRLDEESAHLRQRRPLRAAGAGDGRVFAGGGRAGGGRRALCWSVPAGFATVEKCVRDGAPLGRIKAASASQS